MSKYAKLTLEELREEERCLENRLSLSTREYWADLQRELLWVGHWLAQRQNA